MIPTQDSVTSTPVVLNGNVYFADWGGNVYSASVSTGHVNWEVNLGNVPITSTLLLANGMVYVGDGAGPPGGLADLFALSQTDGHTIWSTTLDTSVYAAYASPIIFNGMVYIGVATNGSETDTSLVGKIFAVNATTGHVAWSFTTSIGNTGGAGVWGSVAIDPSLDSIYFGTSNAYGPGTNSLYSYSILSLNAKTGTLNWYYQAYNSLGSGGDLDFGSTPNLFSVVINGVTHAAVGLGAKDGKYYVLDRVTGSLLEKFQIGTGNGEGGIIGLAGFIYLSQNNPELFIPSYNTVVGGDYGVVKAVTPLDGSLKWPFNTPGTVQGSVVVVPGAVLFGDASGNVFALSTVPEVSCSTRPFQAASRRRHCRRGARVCPDVLRHGGLGRTLRLWLSHNGQTFQLQEGTKIRVELGRPHSDLVWYPWTLSFDGVKPGAIHRACRIEPAAGNDNAYHIQTGFLFSCVFPRRDGLSATDSKVLYTGFQRAANSTSDLQRFLLTVRPNHHSLSPKAVTASSDSSNLNSRKGRSDCTSERS